MGVKFFMTKATVALSALVYLAGCGDLDLTAAVWALEVCESPSTDVAYHGCHLPDQDPVSPWERTQESNGVANLEGCRLVMPVLNEWGFIGYRRFEEALRSARGYVMEARVRIDQYLAVDNHLTYASIGVHDGSKVAALDLTRGPEGEMLAWVCEMDDCVKTPMDWSVYRDYRIYMDRDEAVSFFVDGALIHELPYQRLRFSTLPAEQVVFGGGESVSYWERVEYTVCMDWAELTVAGGGCGCGIGADHFSGLIFWLMALCGYFCKRKTHDRSRPGRAPRLST